MYDNSLRYEWDEAKREASLAKHGVDFAAVEDFDWRRAVVEFDRRRNYGEEREIAVGWIGTRLHVLIFTRRAGAIRIVSLRKANDREVRRHAESNR